MFASDLHLPLIIKSGLAEISIYSASQGARTAGEFAIVDKKKYTNHSSIDHLA